MERNKRVGARKNRGFPGTPVTGRYRQRRLLTHRHHEAFPEEPGEGEVMTSTRPVQCMSVFRSSRPACTGNAKRNVVSRVIPAGGRCAPTWHAALNVTPEPEAYRRGGVKDEEQTTPRDTSSSTVTESMFSFDDEEEDCYSSSSSSSSSLPSPEIFRRENDVGTLIFPMKDEALDPHLHIKNSTLLDVSHAKSIHMHDPPDISTIIYAPATHSETLVFSNHRGPEAETGTQTDSFKSDNRRQEFERISPVKLTNGRVTLYKKKVSLITPDVAVNQEVQRTSVTGTTLPNSSESAGRSKPAEHVRPHAEGSGVGGMNSDNRTPRLRVTLKSPVKRNPEKVRFFDFASDADKDLFTQRARERRVKLWSFTFSPLTAAKSTVNNRTTVKTWAK